MNIGDILNVPIGYIIKFCYDLIPNYAVALLLFAILVKLLLFPLSIKQQKNMVKQAKLQPMPQTEETANMNASMKVMDWTMPLMSVWIAFSMPAVIGVYWIYQNIIGTAQQFISRRCTPLPSLPRRRKGPSSAR